MSELYELPDGWEWKEINNVIVKTKNKTPKNEPEREFTYIDISSINNSTFTIDVPKILIGSEAPSRAKKEVFKNDIVFATTRPNLKNIAIVKVEYNNPIASTGFCILRANETILYQYLFFYVLSNVFYKQVEKNIRGAQYPAVSDTDVKKISIPLPPLPEQKRIVSKLDTLFEKIDKAIALHQKNMDEADVFMGSVLNEVFGELEEKYEKDTLDNLTYVITKGSTPTTYGYKFQDNGINFLKIENIINGEVNINSIDKFISEEAHQSQKRSILRENDVLFSIAGTIGDTAIVKKEHLPMNTNQAVALIRPVEKLNPDFLRRLLSSSISDETVNKKRGGAIKNVSLTDIKATIIPLPPLVIQQKTVKYLDQISEKTEKVKSVQKEKMESLKALKASILDRAFRGKV